MDVMVRLKFVVSGRALVIVSMRRNQVLIPLRSLEEHQKRASKGERKDEDGRFACSMLAIVTPFTVEEGAV
jgi:hypothetical protein